MNFSKNLKLARKAKKLTQQQVADHIMVHRTTYTKYETQNVQPSFEHLCMLSELLGVSTQELLRGDLTASDPSRP